MKNKMRVRFAIVYIILGVVLLGLQFTGIVDDFWGGMGTAFIFIGALFLYRSIKYKTNESYRENVDTQVNDERNRFIAMKAWSWAGYLSLQKNSCRSFPAHEIRWSIWRLQARTDILPRTRLSWR